MVLKNHTDFRFTICFSVGDLFTFSVIKRSGNASHIPIV